jgi:ATP-dependent DNA helicase RecQ
MVDKIQRNHGRAVDPASLAKGFRNLPWALDLMGYPGLRKGQDAIVHNALALRDTLGFLPTGMGKTAVFVIPALCLELRVLIFSPLVALMMDQVKGLWKRGLKAGQISGLQSDSANSAVMMQWLRGEIQFLYVAPERMNNSQFMQIMRERTPDIVVVDEAHTISSWGDSFRPAYAKLGSFIRTFNPRLVLALTATATEEIETDIRDTLGIQDAAKICYMPERTNLRLSSDKHPGEYGLSKLVDNIPGATIVYCSTVKEVESLGANLGNLLPNQVTIFHGQLQPNDKQTAQEQFMQDEIKVMVATNAFGMGIDKPNIRGVVHHDMPGTIEALVQETGRAGRDGLDSTCLALFREQSVHTQRYFVDNSYPSEKFVRRVFDTLLRAPKNSLGEVMLTVDEIADRSGDKWARQGVDACLKILSRAGAVERKRSEEKIGKIQFNSIVEMPRFREYHDVLTRIGSTDTDGLLRFDLGLAVAKLGVSQATVAKNLRQWQGEGYLTYIPPFRGVPTRVIHETADAVPFARLSAKYKEAIAKLEKVQDYFSVPDPDKHAFLRDYFQSA